MIKGIIAGLLTGLIVFGMIGFAIAASENALDADVSENPAPTDIISDSEDNTVELDVEGEINEDVEDEIVEIIDFESEIPNGVGNEDDFNNDEDTDDSEPNLEVNDNTNLIDDEIDANVDSENNEYTDLVGDENNNGEDIENTNLVDNEVIEDEVDYNTNLIDYNSGGGVGGSSNGEILTDEEEEITTFCGEPDVSGNGAVDMADLVMVLAGWGSCVADGDCIEDINNDGNVDDADLQCVLDNWAGEETAECVHSSDVNSDETVDMQDVLDVLSNWGLCQIPFGCPWDITGDAQVDNDDISCVLKDWGQSTGDDPVETGNAQGGGGSGGGNSGVNDLVQFVSYGGSNNKFDFTGIIGRWELSEEDWNLMEVSVYREGLLIKKTDYHSAEEINTFDFLNNEEVYNQFVNL